MSGAAQGSVAEVERVSRASLGARARAMLGKGPARALRPIAKLTSVI